jgi:membrane protein insertase Oxa1/YidC/SpoIIIJ
MRRGPSQRWAAEPEMMMMMTMMIIIIVIIFFNLPFGI